MTGRQSTIGTSPKIEDQLRLFRSKKNEIGKMKTLVIQNELHGLSRMQLWNRGQNVHVINSSPQNCLKICL